MWPSKRRVNTISVYAHLYPMSLNKRQQVVTENVTKNKSFFFFFFPQVSLKTFRKMLVDKDVARVFLN